MERAFTNGHLERFMMANGAVAAKMDTVFGKAKTAILTSENGKTLKPTVTACILGHPEINTKASGRNA